MKNVVLDSFALLAYFEKEPGWESVARRFAEAAGKNDSLLLSVVNWGEVLYITQRIYGTEATERVEEAMDTLPICVPPADRKLTTRAAQLKAAGGMAYADCFSAALALQEEGILVTGNPEFEVVAGQVQVDWLAREGR